MKTAQICEFSRSLICPLNNRLLLLATLGRVDVFYGCWARKYCGIDMVGMNKITVLSSLLYVNEDVLNVCYLSGRWTDTKQKMGQWKAEQRLERTAKT